MTPLEKAKAEEGLVNYCDECEQFEIVGNAAYCKASGKLIHPIMLMRGQGTGPAWNCKKRIKPVTNADRIRRMTDEELAKFIAPLASCPHCYARKVNIEDCGYDCKKAWLDWLKEEVQDGEG